MNGSNDTPPPRDEFAQAYRPTRDARRFSRRGVLGMLGAGAVGLGAYGGFNALGRGGSGFGDDAEDSDRPVKDAKLVKAGDAANRVLLVVDLAGGNDWVSTLVPYGDGNLHSLRKGTLPEMEKLIRVDDRYAAHPALASTGRGMAFIGGVGTSDPNGSHFEMAARWASGDGSGKKTMTTGFLGRLCDELDQGAPITGISLAGTAPTMLSRKSVTLGLPDGGGLEWLSSKEPWFRNLRDGIDALGTAAKGDSDAAAVARSGLSKALRFSALLAGMEGENKDYPGGPLSEQLAIAARLIGANAGIRVIYVMLGGFDTHTGQKGNHDALMNQIDESVAAFQADLERRGAAESTLVCTTSEFGRRPKENGSGTDHGTASVAMLWGPVKPGVHGQPPSLTDFDGDDNFKPTVSLEEYYATLAERWLGVDAASVLPVKAKPLDGLINQ